MPQTIDDQGESPELVGVQAESAFSPWTPMPLTPLRRNTKQTTDEHSPALTSATISNTPGISEQDPLHPPHEMKRREVLWLTTKNTATSVATGVAIMLLGIGIVQVAILPRIYTCPADAECRGAFDPNTTNVLQLLQTLMDY